MHFFHHFLSHQLQTSIYQWNSILKSESPPPPLTVFEQILQSSLKPNDLTTGAEPKFLLRPCLTNTSSSYSAAQQIHTHLLKCGFHQFVVVGTALLNLSAKYDMRNRDVVSWNALICEYSYNGYDLDSLELFCEMLHQVQRFRSTRFLFDKMSDKCIVSWNTMISAYGQNGYFDEAMLVFKQMLKEIVSVSSVTIVSLLSADNSPMDSTHSYVIKTGLDMDSSVITSLICMYPRCGRTDCLVSLTPIISSYAEKGDMASAVHCFIEIRLVDLKPDATVFSLFRDLQERTLISWNSIISSCVQLGRWDDAMKLFFRMKIDGCNLDPTTIVSIHHLEMEDFVLTGLIDMYTKCGSIRYAERLFRCIRQPMFGYLECDDHGLWYMWL
ncbi:hypothetical protein MKX03_036690 [Papaver bracteatum]|nr:hypothetical protein MKX03_036690 [Papaver bracteatum]